MLKFRAREIAIIIVSRWSFLSLQGKKRSKITIQNNTYCSRIQVTFLETSIYFSFHEGLIITIELNFILIKSDRVKIMIELGVWVEVELISSKFELRLS